MQEISIGAVYVFESALYGGERGGLYRHEVLGYLPEDSTSEARYVIRAWRVEVTEKPGHFAILDGPVVAKHEAEAIHRWYATRW